MDSKIVAFIAGLLMLWIGASGLATGEVGLTIGILMPAIKFKREKNPAGFWLSVAFYLVLGVGLVGTAVYRFVTQR